MFILKMTYLLQQEYFVNNKNLFLLLSGSLHDHYLEAFFMSKKILIIHTCGTISMSEDETGTVKPTDHNPITQHTKELTDLGELIIEEPFQLPSPHITIKEMLTLKTMIEEYSKQGIDGVVITHGTDTLEETAYFLDLTTDTSFPIIVTGAMRSSNEIGSDGLYNVISSFRVASSEDAKNKGVLVVLNDEIPTASNVTKTHTSNVSKIHFEGINKVQKAL